jgi:DNA-directed RNA polymerase specialized sigma subunit
MSFEQFEQNSKPLILKAIKPIVNDMEYQIMELKLLYDFNYAEIAEILNVKTKKIDNIFARLMKKLKSEEVKKYISIELDLEYMEREIE